MKTVFNLDQSIAAWRAPLAGKLSDANLTKLETHLRESFAELRARRLADDEAFHLAGRRLGGAELAEEFAKVHPDALWAERGRWMLFGVPHSMCFGAVCASSPQCSISASVASILGRRDT